MRHYDKVGVLAGVLTQLREAQISVQEMSNTIYQGAKAAVAVMRLDKKPNQALIDAIAERREEIIQVQLKAV